MKRCFNITHQWNASQTEVDQYGKYTTSWRYVSVIHSKASKHWHKNIKTSRERNLYKFTTWRINCIFGFKWIMWIQNGQSFYACFISCLTCSLGQFMVIWNLINLSFYYFIILRKLKTLQEIRMECLWAILVFKNKKYEMFGVCER